METQIVLLNLSQEVTDIHEELKKTGPHVARWFKGKVFFRTSSAVVQMTTRLSVVYMIKYWGSLTASPSEAEWAREKIKKEVIKTVPWYMVIAMKILVGWIIEWFLVRRDTALDARISDIRDMYY